MGVGRGPGGVVSRPKVNARLEHVTRKGDRRSKSRRVKKEEPSSWSDRLEKDCLAQAAEELTKNIEKDLFNPEGPKMLGLEAQMAAANPPPFAAAPAANEGVRLGPTNLSSPPKLMVPTPQEIADFEMSKLKNMARAQQITIKKLERALAAAQVKILDLELDALLKENDQ